MKECHFSVIIVGAGASGIAASSRLLKNNFTDFVVLEAEGRIGGRVNSVKFGDSLVDLGAQWCHGQEGNASYELVKDYNILRTTNFDIPFYNSSREEVDPKFSHEINSVFFDLYTPGGDREEQEGITVGEYFQSKFNKMMLDRYAHDRDKLKTVEQVMDCLHRIVLSSEGSFSWHDSSAENDYRDCEGDLDLNWNGLGYQTVLNVLMGKFPDSNQKSPIDGKILLKKKVTQIAWGKSPSNSKGVTVECSDGSVYKADQVIVTFSLGVLKRYHNAIFTPKLPISKQLAIEELGIGSVIKVFIHFPKRWWPEKDFTGFYLIWNAKDKVSAAQEFPDGPQEEGKSWILDMYAIYPVDKNPKALTVWFAGSFVPQIEQLSGETLINGIMFTLKKFFGHKYDIPNPDGYLSSNWYSNPNFHGAYCFQTLKSRRRKPSGNIELSKPISNEDGNLTLLFAGEATHHRYYSSVHGAIETGYREADRIISSRMRHKM